MAENLQTIIGSAIDSLPEDGSTKEFNAYKQELMSANPVGWEAALDRMIKTGRVRLSVAFPDGVKTVFIRRA